jgi:hypothetical protein
MNEFLLEGRDFRDAHTQRKGCMRTQKQAVDRDHRRNQTCKHLVLDTKTVRKQISAVNVVFILAALINS